MRLDADEIDLIRHYARIGIGRVLALRRTDQVSRRANAHGAQPWWCRNPSRYYVPLTSQVVSATTRSRSLRWPCPSSTTTVAPGTPTNARWGRMAAFRANYSRSTPPKSSKPLKDREGRHWFGLKRRPK